MKRKYPVMFCLLFSLVCGNVTAQKEEVIQSEYSYRRYTTADGLPSMINNSLIQDGKGFIWIAGTKGLTRYDGITFTNYIEGRDINLYRIDRDNYGNVRAFSRNLCYTFNKEEKLTETVLSPDKRLTMNSSFLLPDSYGIYSDDAGNQALYRIVGNQLKKVLEHPVLTDFQDDMHSFYDIEKQQLYLFYDTDTVRVITDGNNVTTYTGWIGRSACKFNGWVYIMAENGIYRTAGEKPELLFAADLRNKVLPAKIIADSQGMLYFNIDNILYRFDGQKIETLFQANGIKDFLIDKEGNLWVTTTQGLYNLFNLYFRKYSLTDENDVVRAVMFHSTNNVITAATLNGKIIEIGKNGNREIHYPTNPYGAAFFYDYIAEKDGTLYLAGPGDILMLGKKEKRWLHLPFFNTPLFTVTMPNGNLLEGGWDNLFEYTPQGKLVGDIGTHFREQGIPLSVHAKPCFDRNGRLWIGGGRGVTVLDYADQKIVKNIKNDSVNIVRYMNNDREGNVWFASENRLYVSNGDTVRQERTLPQLIQAIYFTKKSNTLIVATLNGICIFDKTRQNYVFYDQNNGYTGGESSSGAIAEDADGNIWLPALAGLFCFNPKKLLFSLKKSDLQLISTTSSTDNIHWMTIGELNPKLNYRHKNIRFSYLGLLYSATQNIRYRYRLIGFQNEWSEPTKNREVIFNNLPPGDYIFEIYADAGADESRSETQSVTFSIQPAFWQTAWFFMASIAFLILASVGVTLHIQRRKNKALLDKLRIEKELNELRISSIRLKAIPHFNANVLAAIEYYIANRTKDEAMRILGIYSNFTLKTLSEVDKAARPLSEELAYVKMYLDLEKIRFMEKFDFRIDVEDEVDNNVQLPNMILHTYCENAVKHGLIPLKSGGLLTIHVSQRDRTVYVSVEDNGVGRACAAQNPNRQSTKQGLAILNRQIEIYNSFNREKISQQVEDLLKDGKPEGTRFTIEVPADFVYTN
ncbi:MAG: histidine kinase [Dysgonamonadaceae bacterium]|jgi:ligand-binding sensor domain-containing protein|nr:histidine kinase [Dysgonamonadaceae bacterium]